MASSKTFYKKPLPSPPAVAFSSVEGEASKQPRNIHGLQCPVHLTALAGTPSPCSFACNIGKRLFSEALMDGTLEGFFKLIEQFR